MWVPIIEVNTQKPQSLTTVGREDLYQRGLSKLLIWRRPNIDSKLRKYFKEKKSTKRKYACEMGVIRSIGQ